MMLRAFLKPLGTLVFAVAFAYMWSRVGPAIIRELQSGDPEEVSSILLAIVLLGFLGSFTLQFTRALYRPSLRTAPALGRAVLSSEADEATSRSFNPRAREAARALHGPQATTEEINKAAETIADGWSGRPSLTRRQASRHEAAHAVVAHHFGAIIMGSSVDEGGNGEVSFVVPPRPLTAAEDSWMRLCIALAGNVLDHAEESHNVGSALDYAEAHAQAVALISTGQAPAELSGTLTIENILETGRESVLRILAPQNSAIYEIARQLEAQGELTGFEVNTILSERFKTS